MYVSNSVTENKHAFLIVEGSTDGMPPLEGDDDDDASKMEEVD